MIEAALLRGLSYLEPSPVAAYEVTGVTAACHR